MLAHENKMDFSNDCVRLADACPRFPLSSISGRGSKKQSDQEREAPHFAVGVPVIVSPVLFQKQSNHFLTLAHTVHRMFSLMVSIR